MGTTTPGLEVRQRPADLSVEDMILGLPADQQKAVAAVLAIVAGQVTAARDEVRHDPSARWSGLADAAYIVGHAAAYAQGVVAGQ